MVDKQYMRLIISLLFILHYQFENNETVYQVVSSFSSLSFIIYVRSDCSEQSGISKIANFVMREEMFKFSHNKRSQTFRKCYSLAKTTRVKYLIRNVVSRVDFREKNKSDFVLEFWNFSIFVSIQL